MRGFPAKEMIEGAGLLGGLTQGGLGIQARPERAGLLLRQIAGGQFLEGLARGGRQIGGGIRAGLRRGGSGARVRGERPAVPPASSCVSG